LGKRVIRIEFEDGDGGEYSFKLEGKLTREKILKLIDIYELMNLKTEQEEIFTNQETIYGRLLSLVYDDFSIKRFTSKELLEAYEDKFNEPIKLSTISTYLKRMCENGKLTRRKVGKEWYYNVKVTQQPIRKRSFNRLI
jgi:hypothetical protein